MTRFEKALLKWSAFIVAVTGFVYMGMKYGLQPAQPWDAVNHPLQPLVLKLHILSAPVLVFAIGLITTRHIWRHYRENVTKGRRSGITTALVTGPMVVSGYLIQAVTHGGWLQALAIAHIAFSVIFTAGMLVHDAMTGRRAKKTRPRKAAASARAGV